MLFPHVRLSWPRQQEEIFGQMGFFGREGPLKTILPLPRLLSVAQGTGCCLKEKRFNWIHILGEGRQRQEDKKAWAICFSLRFLMANRKKLLLARRKVCSYGGISNTWMFAMRTRIVKCTVWKETPFPGKIISFLLLIAGVMVKSVKLPINTQFSSLMVYFTATVLQFY